jgi:hypothetical protein
VRRKNVGRKKVGRKKVGRKKVGRKCRGANEGAQMSGRNCRPTRHAEKCLKWERFISYSAISRKTSCSDYGCSKFLNIVLDTDEVVN